MVNSADPDQFEEAYWSGSTLFAEVEIAGASRTKGWKEKSKWLSSLVIILKGSLLVGEAHLS